MSPDRAANGGGGEPRAGKSRAARHGAVIACVRTAGFIAALAAAACGSDETQASSTTGTPSDQGTWSLVFEELPGALPSIWGSSATDVWSVGGDPGDGTGPMVLHFDGSRWTRRKTGESGDLWWVFGFAGGPVFMGGQGGLILRWQNGAFEKMPTPGTNTVFGIWGTSPEDLWAVGGAGTTPTGGFAWRFDGSSWKEAEGFPAEAAKDATVFKVWGRSANEVWLVGTGGLILRYDGKAFVEEASPTPRTLFTVHASSDRVAAVGGFSTGVVLENDGAGWADVTPAGAPQMSGVCLTEDRGYAAGVMGAVLRRTESGWAPEETGLEVREDLHATWIDPDGGVWAVGGQVAAFPLIRGVMIHKGSEVAGGSYVEE